MAQTYVPAELRTLVEQRGRERCEYCLIPAEMTFAPLEVDHIVAEKHGGKTTEENLALSCSLCNKYKGSDLTSIDPQTGAIVRLFHPRQDEWSVHFSVADSHIVPLTPTGRVTVRLLRLNRPDRVAERAVLAAAGLLPPAEHRG